MLPENEAISNWRENKWKPNGHFKADCEDMKGPKVLVLDITPYLLVEIIKVIIKFVKSGLTF